MKEQQDTVTDDIVTRLRTWPLGEPEPLAITVILGDAATEIERLHTEVNDLRLQLVKLSLPKEARRG